MYGEDVRWLALEAIAEGCSRREAAEIAGCSLTTVCRWAAEGGGPRPGRKEPVYLPLERKLELVRRYEAGERAAELAAGAGVTGPAVTRWARLLREEGVTSLMTERDARAAGPEPAAPPSELEELRARCEELELRNAILEGTIEILKKTQAPTCPP